MLNSMAQFLIVTPDSLSLQRSPIMHINRRRLSKRDYIVHLRTLCKYLFYRRLSYQKNDITFDFIEALRLECDMAKNLSVSGILPLKELSFVVYQDILFRWSNHDSYEKQPILFNLDTYELSFYDSHSYPLLF